MQQDFPSPLTTKKDSCSCKEEEVICDNDLQVSCSLETCTTCTTASSGFTTPTGDAGAPNNGGSENAEKWKTFYNHVDNTPPKATRTTLFDETIAIANNLLKLSEADEFKDKSFDSLTKDQQAILVFMIVKDMHKAFGGESLCMAAKALIRALNPGSPEYKRMMSFVRLGGDRAYPFSRRMERSYLNFTTNQQPGWKLNRATTIFHANPEMTPFIYIQTEESYVCAFVACASLLYYWSFKQEHHTEVEETTRNTFKMNVSRFVRDEISGQKIANLTLTDVKGAQVKDVLLSLLQVFGTTGGDPEIQGIPTFQDNEESTYSVLELLLRNGHPIVFAMECLPSLTDTKLHEYTGTVKGHYERNKQARPDLPSQRSYHALLCIGIDARNGSQPPMLVVQDSSCPERPFFSVGLDLLMDMGLNNLQFCTVSEEWKFNPNQDYIMSPETKSRMCGFPMVLDDNGVARVVFPEEPAREIRDMRRYFDWIEVKEGQVLVYET